MITSDADVHLGRQKVGGDPIEEAYFVHMFLIMIVLAFLALGQHCKIRTQILPISYSFCLSRQSMTSPM